MKRIILFGTLIVLVAAACQPRDQVFDPIPIPKDLVQASWPDAPVELFQVSGSALQTADLGGLYYLGETQQSDPNLIPVFDMGQNQIGWLTNTLPATISPPTPTMLYKTVVKTRDRAKVIEVFANSEELVIAALVKSRRYVLIPSVNCYQMFIYPGVDLYIVHSSIPGGAWNCFSNIMTYSPGAKVLLVDMGEPPYALPTDWKHYYMDYENTRQFLEGVASILP